MSEEQPKSDVFLRVIAIFKLTKAVLFLSAGLGLLHLLNKDVEQSLLHVMNQLHLDSENHLARWCLSAAGELTKPTLVELSAIAIFYSVLFATEGIGLYLKKRWAEWMVVVVTSSLLPLEIYELTRSVNWAKVMLIVGNLIILGYLIYVIRKNAKAVERKAVV